MPVSLPFKTPVGSNKLKFHLYFMTQGIDIWPHLAAREAGEYIILA
jgi:hypothetical protein